MPDKQKNLDEATTHTSAYDFSAMARRLAAAAHVVGLDVPGFRTPPRSSGTRTVRRFRDGSILVAVRTHGRASEAVLIDMIEGVIVANNLHGARAQEARQALQSALCGPSAKAA